MVLVLIREVWFGPHEIVQLMYSASLPSIKIWVQVSESTLKKAKCVGTYNPSTGEVEVSGSQELVGHLVAYLVNSRSVEDPFSKKKKKAGKMSQCVKALAILSSIPKTHRLHIKVEVVLWPLTSTLCMAHVAPQLSDFYLKSRHYLRNDPWLSPDLNIHMYACKPAHMYLQSHMFKHPCTNIAHAYFSFPNTNAYAQKGGQFQAIPVGSLQGSLPIMSSLWVHRHLS